MARKSKSRRGEKPRADDSGRSIGNKPVSFTPFKDLKKMLAGAARNRLKPASESSTRIAAPAAKAAMPGSSTEDAMLLSASLEGVRPLRNGRGSRVPIEPRLNRPVVSEIVSEDAEVIARLSDLVSGQANFDITETEEYVEGARVGLDPRLVARMRRGEFAMQNHIDLHGMTQVDAHQALTDFILDSVRKGHRSVLVVHGRGLGSPGGRPVLKHAAAEWLSHGAIGAHVLAFTTSRMQDGGAGAMYVLLRREKQRAPFDILMGAKRRD